MDVIRFSQEPRLADSSVEQNYPVILSFTASSSESATFVVNWGDGVIHRSVLTSNEQVRLTHPYKKPGSYAIALQTFASDDSTTSKLTVVARPPRLREKPLYRWSGPVTGVKTISEFNSVVERSKAPVEYRLLEEAKAGASTVTLVGGTNVPIGSKVTVMEDGKLVSGGSVRNVVVNQEKVVVELNFFLTDAYSTEAFIQVVANSPMYGRSASFVNRPLHFISGRDDALIFDSVGLILATSPGERVMRPDFGFRGRELAFDQNDSTLSALASSYVIEALGSEPRALATDIAVKQHENALRVSGNLLFPSGNLAAFSHDLLSVQLS